MAKSTPVHTRMVNSLYKRLVREGFKGIMANHLRGVGRPEAIIGQGPCSGSIPDAVAKLGKIPHIFEVETPEMVDNEQTIELWKLFAAHAQSVDGRFIPVVPAGSKKLAERLMKQHGIVYAAVWAAE